MSIASRIITVLIAAGLLAALPAADTQSSKNTTKSPDKSAKDKNAKVIAPVGPKAGIKTPGVQIPAASLKSEIEIPVEEPGWITVADSIMVASKSKDSLIRIDPKANKTLDPVGDLKKPCSGTINAFGTLWIPNCENGTVVRADPKTFKVSATLAFGAADVTMGIAATADSVWMLTDNRGTLSRIDPVQNVVVGEMRMPTGCNQLMLLDNSLWLNCPSGNEIYRINPLMNVVEKKIEVSAGPREMAQGDNSLWVLCEKDGKIDRIDPKTNKVIKTIELNVPSAGGSLAYGEGYLWVTQTGFPITRIDTQSDKVVQQFWGDDGGGQIATSAGAIWLTDTSKGKVVRYDPKRILATLAE